MPRKSRIDAPGALHHVIARGINRQRIFLDDADRNRFLDRLRNLLCDSQTACYAWALVGNHFHLLLRSGGSASISHIMRRLLTGYAINFNLRHNRCGHVFQNRFKSILCQEDSYLLELVRYIHLNPLRAGIVASYKELRGFAFCGHGVILGSSRVAWQDTDYVLKMFAGKRRPARQRYEEYVKRGIGKGRRPELTGGGLIRSLGGWSAVKAMRREDAYQKGDERILGDGDFVQEVLSAAAERLERRYRLAAEGYDFSRLVARVAELTDVPIDRLVTPDRSRSISQARGLLCFWATRELGISQIDLAQRLQMTQSAVSQAIQRGRRLALEMNCSIELE
jgi:REP element-mobilizing transposase RayT